MRASAAALPRRRYWKPPSRWTVLWFLMVANGLSRIGYLVLTLRADVWNALSIALWIFVFPYYWDNYKKAKRQDERESDAPSGFLGVGALFSERIWWAMALGLTAVNVASWVLFLGFGKTHL